MTITLLPTTQQIREAFCKEVTAAGGTVSDTFEDRDCLLMRSILPLAEEVRPRDLVQGGAALRVSGAQIMVHPYVFRQVCRNGAIMAQTLGTEHLERIEGEEWMASTEAGAEVLSAVCAAVSASLRADLFAAARAQMRAASATEAQTDLVLTLLSHFPGLPAHARARLVADILERFTQQRDPSQFGLMNAVTSVARDIQDPQIKWRLEELGGAIPALRAPVPRPMTGSARAPITDTEPGRRGELHRAGAVKIGC
jgi:hypothetical protein